MGNNKIKSGVISSYLCKKGRILFCLFGMVVIGLFSLCSVGEANAKVKSGSDLYYLSLLQGATKCYEKWAKDSFTATSSFDYLTVFKDGYDTSSNSDFWITTGVGNTLKDGNVSDLSCLQLFHGYPDSDHSQAMGLVSGFNGKVPDKPEKMGYELGSTDAPDIAILSLNLSGSSQPIKIGTDTMKCYGEESEHDSDGGLWKLYYCVGEIVLQKKTSGGNFDTLARVSFDYDKNTEQLDVECETNIGDGSGCDFFSSISGQYYGKNQGTSLVSGSKKHKSLAGELEWEDNGKPQRGDTNFLLRFENFFMNALVLYATDNLHPGEYDFDVKNEIDLDGSTCPSDTVCVGVHAKMANSEDGASEYKLIGGIDNAAKKWAAGVMLYNVVGKSDNLPNVVSEKDGKSSVAYLWKANGGTNTYIYSLYYNYLVNLGKKYEKISFGGNSESEGKICWEGKREDKNVEYAFKNTDKMWCSVNLPDTVKEDALKETVTIVGGSSDELVEGSIKDILDWLNVEANYDFPSGEYSDVGKDSNGFLNMGTGEVDDPTTPVDDNGGGTGSVSATCQSSGGAGAVGWIVCPILEWMGNSATDLYTSYVEPRLRINPKLFQEIDGTNQSPTREASLTFQSIANIIFIILLIIVIISQLTGVGIDNYGIKRILPKLIVVAILVNLSYLICVICVDLSNILGSSLKGLFDGLGATLGDVPVNTGVAETSALGNDGWVPVVIFGILVTTLIVGVASVIMNPAILLTLLISGIGVAISVLFIFVLFAVREAAVVIMTVVAPIAFACYILPNTKKIFDKWLKVWEGLLLVYPICGLLIGGGDYISRLLIKVEGSGDSPTGFFQLMTAMVVGIVPIFFLPTVLKGSFAAMGNIGAKISGVGKALGGRVTGGLTNSDANKNAQRMGAERRGRMKAGLNSNGEMTKLAQWKAKRARARSLSTVPVVGRAIRGIGKGQMKSQAARIAAAKKDFSAGEAASALLMNEMAVTGMSKAGNAESYYGNLLKQAAAKGDKSSFDAALTAASQSGYMKPKDVISMVRKMENNRELSQMQDGAFWQRMANKHSDVMSTDFEMLQWALAGGAGATDPKKRDLGGYGEYAKNYIDVNDIKPEDISKLSGDSMAGMIAAGKINKGMAEQALLNGNNLTQDKRVMLGAVASGAATAGSIAAAGGGSVSEGAHAFKGEAGALMSDPGATKWQDGDKGEKKISAIHTQAAEGSATWSEPNGAGGSTTYPTARKEDIEKWMAPKSAPVHVDNMDEFGGGGGGSGYDGGDNNGGGSVRNGLVMGENTEFNVRDEENGAPDVQINPGGDQPVVSEEDRLNAYLSSQVEANEQAQQVREAGRSVNVVPEAESFAGETNVNRATGKTRTRNTFDLYPPEEGESNEAYTARLRRMTELREQFQNAAQDATPNPTQEVIQSPTQEVTQGSTQGATQNVTQADANVGYNASVDMKTLGRNNPREPGESTNAWGERLNGLKAQAQSAAQRDATFAHNAPIDIKTLGRNNPRKPGESTNAWGERLKKL